jgi:hypothetical protein
MYKLKKYFILTFILFIPKLFGQEIQSDTVFHPAESEMINLTGPRLGFTVITVKSADKLKDDFNASPFITQFGWQWETRFFTTEDGLTGVTEFVPLIGGLEQGLFLPSLNLLVGLRAKSGFEFGAGPNVALTGAAYVIAVGSTSRHGSVNFPVNVSAVLSQKGVRISLIFGFNVAN